MTKKKEKKKKKGKKKEKIVVRRGFEHITQVLGVVCIYDTLVKFYSYTVFLLANHDFFCFVLFFTLVPLCSCKTIVKYA